MAATASRRVYCSVYGCLNSTVINPKLSFFQLPADAERRSEWLRLISREDLLNKKPKCYRVCEEHFKELDILPGPIRKKLKIIALPCLKLPGLQKTETPSLVVPKEEIITDTTTHNTTPTSASLSVDTPRKRKLQSDLSECRKKVKLDQIDFQTDKVQKVTFHKLCDKFLTKELATLVKTQTCLKFRDTGNTYNNDYIIFCLNLYNTSAKAYRLLQSALGLPCPSTLSKHYIPITTEIDDRIMLALKTKVERMSEQEKNCSVLVNAMSLKENLFYDIKADKIIGFHEIEGVQTAETAKNALVMMICGIFSDWKQPVAFALLSERQNYNEVATWIDRLLEKIIECGLNIRTFVSNMGSDLLQVEKKRSITFEKPYFFINQRKIYYVIDAAHLIKSVRDNLMLYDFHFNDKVAKYEHIVQFYDQDKQKSFKIAHKLTDKHIKPSNFEKTKVCYAKQLLSYSVATGIATYIDFKAIDETGRDTVELVKLMNNLYDALNSSNKKDNCEYRRAFTGEESQIFFFKEMLIFFQSLKLINPTNECNVTSKIEFIQGFQITIQSILLLFEDIKLEGHSCLLTKRLNQDKIESLLGQKDKNGVLTEPTSRQLMVVFRKLFFANILTPVKGGICDDLGKILIQSDHTGPKNNQQACDDSVKCESCEGDEEFNNIQIRRTDYTKMNVPKKNSFVHVCGFLLKKCGEVHKDCYVFKSYIKPSLNQTINDFSADSRYLRYKEYSENTCSSLLAIPPDDFVNYVEKMEEKIQSTLKKKYINCKILASIFNEIKGINLTPLPCPCFPKVFLIKLFIRIRIFHTMKFNNKALKNNKKSCKYFCISNV